ncbi:hypothetical protein ABZ297_26185 [Nonomuraea sp. NPDC005983]|uniref:hypothetical protein n=1 Tax=Nonomuraea sp. NPDC005983 TaxID=3155595 RepID=UPI0033B14F69
MTLVPLSRDERFSSMAMQAPWEKSDGVADASGRSARDAKKHAAVARERAAGYRAKDAHLKAVAAAAGHEAQDSAGLLLGEASCSGR